MRAIPPTSSEKKETKRPKFGKRKFRLAAENFSRSLDDFWKGGSAILLTRSGQKDLGWFIRNFDKAVRGIEGESKILQITRLRSLLEANPDDGENVISLRDKLNNLSLDELERVLKLLPSWIFFYDTLREEELMKWNQKQYNLLTQREKFDLFCDIRLFASNKIAILDDSVRNEVEKASVIVDSPIIDGIPNSYVSRIAGYGYECAERTKTKKIYRINPSTKKENPTLHTEIAVDFSEINDPENEKIAYDVDYEWEGDNSIVFFFDRKENGIKLQDECFFLLANISKELFEDDREEAYEFLSQIIQEIEGNLADDTVVKQINLLDKIIPKVKEKLTSLEEQKEFVQYLKIPKKLILVKNKKEVEVNISEIEEPESDSFKIERVSEEYDDEEFEKILEVSYEGNLVFDCYEDKSCQKAAKEVMLGVLDKAKSPEMSPITPVSRNFDSFSFDLTDMDFSLDSSGSDDFEPKAVSFTENTIERKLIVRDKDLQESFKEKIQEESIDIKFEYTMIIDEDPEYVLDASNFPQWYIDAFNKGISGKKIKDPIAIANIDNDEISIDEEGNLLIDRRYAKNNRIGKKAFETQEYSIKKDKVALSIDSDRWFVMKNEDGNMQLVINRQQFRRDIKSFYYNPDPEAKIDPTLSQHLISALAIADNQRLSP